MRVTRLWCWRPSVRPAVVIDLAGETGGNCELTEPGQEVIKHDVMIRSPLNLPAGMPERASELYPKNVFALIELMPDEGGAIVPDFDDEILAAACVTREPVTESAQTGEAGA